MPDLEAWLSDVERRHRTHGEYLDLENGGIYQQRCRGCFQDWPCDAAQAARVIREYQRNLSRTISEAIPLHECYQDALNTNRRIAAIIEGRDDRE